MVMDKDDVLAVHEDPAVAVVNALSPAQFAGSGGMIRGRSGRIVNYCGGGVSATIDFFIQTLMGYDDIAVYDASMNEWGAEDSLPMEQG